MSDDIVCTALMPSPPQSPSDLSGSEKAEQRLIEYPLNLNSGSQKTETRIRQPARRPGTRAEKPVKARYRKIAMYPEDSTRYVTPSVFS